MRRPRIGDILDKRFHALWLLLSLIVLYAFFNPLRLEHWAMLLVFAGMVSASPTSRGLAVAAWPAAIFGFAYDLMRLLLNRAYDMGPSIWTHGLERALFGWMSPANSDLGPVDYFTTHNWLAVDLVAGLWYSTHVPSVIIFGLYIWWRTHRGREETARRLDTYFWGFLLFNLVGMLVWTFWPVAPPWWVKLHGFAAPQTLDLPQGLLGSPAGLARVDAWLGHPHFAQIYRHSTYVFGAMPSLHAAAPVWVALWTRKKWLRALAWAYALAMCFFAVYLTHHYLVDVLAGALLALSVYLALAHSPVGNFFVGVNAWLRNWLNALFGAGAQAPAPELNPATCAGEPEPSDDQDINSHPGTQQ